MASVDGVPGGAFYLNKLGSKTTNSPALGGQSESHPALPAEVFDRVGSTAPTGGPSSMTDFAKQVAADAEVAKKVSDEIKAELKEASQHRAVLLAQFQQQLDQVTTTCFPKSRLVASKGDGMATIAQFDESGVTGHEAPHLYH